MEKTCWPCEMSGSDGVEATHDGCRHLTTLVPQDAARYGLCDECFAAGPCRECEGELIKAAFEEIDREAQAECDAGMLAEYRADRAEDDECTEEDPCRACKLEAEWWRGER